MQPASAGGSVRLAMSSVYATSKCMLDYYRKGNMARDEPQLVRAYGRKNFDPVIKEWKWPDSPGGPKSLDPQKVPVKSVTLERCKWLIVGVCVLLGEYNWRVC